MSYIEVFIDRAIQSVYNLELLYYFITLFSLGAICYSKTKGPKTKSINRLSLSLSINGCLCSFAKGGPWQHPIHPVHI
jgi:hypothetical protein